MLTNIITIFHRRQTCSRNRQNVVSRVLRNTKSQYNKSNPLKSMDKYQVVTIEENVTHYSY